MRIVRVVWDRLEPPIWELSLDEDEEGAGTWLVNVTESTEVVGPMMLSDGLVSGVETGVFEVEEEVVVDEVDELVVVDEERVELVEVVELVLDVDELDEVCREGSASQKIVRVEAKLSHRGARRQGRRCTSDE